MKLGVFFFTGDRAPPVLDFARTVEGYGFESLWVPEHVHIPTVRTTPFPGAADGVLPPQYFRCADPLLTLAVAGAATTTLKLGTGVCLVSEREPLGLAKAIATLDRDSQGRVVFGIGAGWLREEMETLGTPFEARWDVTTERVAALKALWTAEEAEFHGEWVDIPRTTLLPKPAQSPHPPIHIGAVSRWSRQRVVDWADGWMPLYADPRFIEKGMQDLRERALAAGRDPDSIETTVFGAELDALAEYRRLGVDRCIFMLEPGSAQRTRADLARVAGEVGL